MDNGICSDLECDVVPVEDFHPLVAYAVDIANRWEGACNSWQEIADDWQGLYMNLLKTLGKNDKQWAVKRLIVHTCARPRGERVVAEEEGE